MNKVFKRIAAAVTAVAVTATAGIFTASAEAVTYLRGSDTDDLVNIMKNYCFIALDELDVRGHQHGSAIADRIVRNPTPESGTSVESELCLRNEYGPTTSYIRRFENLVGTVKIGLPKDTLYIGSEYTAEKRGSQNFIVNSFGGNEHIVDNAGTVVADTDTVKYMDLDNLKKSFISYNKQLAKTSASGTVTQSGQLFTVNATEGIVYYNINASNYNSINADSTIDFPAASTAILVLNIDMNGIAEWNRKFFVLTEGGSTVTCGEEVINYQTANRIYYNFYDSSKTDLQYTGTIRTDDKGWGTIIAPSADLTVGSNFCGVLIASSVTATGETHFVGAYNPVTPIAETPVAPTNPTECKTEIEFDKVDGSNGCALEGALFGIYSDSACTNELLRASSDSSGIVHFQNISAGTYYLKEIEPPTGFKKNEEIYTAYVVFDTYGNGSVTFGDERRTKLTVPNDPVAADVTPSVPVTPSEPQVTTTKATTPATVNPTNPSDTTTSDESGVTTTTTTTTVATTTTSTSSTSYIPTTPPYIRPATTTTVAVTTTTTKSDSSANVTTAGQGGNSDKKTDSTKKTTAVTKKTTKNESGTTTKKTTKNDGVTTTKKTTKTDKNGEIVTNKTDKTTVSVDENTPVTSKTSKTDTTRPPEVTTSANGDVDADKDVVTTETSNTSDSSNNKPENSGTGSNGSNDKPENSGTGSNGSSNKPENSGTDSNSSNDNSESDGNSVVTTAGDNELELIVVTSNHDNSTGIDFSTITDSTNDSDNPYTGVENAAGIAIVFAELALAAAILKKKKNK